MFINFAGAKLVGLINEVMVGGMYKFYGKLGIMSNNKNSLSL